MNKNSQNTTVALNHTESLESDTQDILSTPSGKPRSTVAQKKLEQALVAAKTYAQKSLAPATRKAYASDWRIFEEWCAETQVISLPAKENVVAMFLGSQAYSSKLSPSTLTRRLAAIDLVHKGLSYASPCSQTQVKKVMQGIRRDSNKTVVKKAPTMPADIKRMVDSCPDSGNRGLRDRAILLLGFATAMRRSELVALDSEHVEYVYEKDTRELVGIRITIPNSKTDQEKKGQVIAVPAQTDSAYCPVQSLTDWMMMKLVGEPAIFLRIRKGDSIAMDKETNTPARLTPQSIALLVKDYAFRVGLNSSQFSGHSFRRGWLTAASQEEGVDIFKMAEHSRHKSMDVLRGYVDDAKNFDRHAGQDLLK